MSAFPVQEYRQRIETAQAALREQALSASVVVAPELLYYFSGYDGHTHFSDQALVIGIEGDPTLVYRDVDAGLAAESCWLSDQRTYHYGETNALDLIAEAVREHAAGGTSIGVDFDTHALKGSKAFALEHRLNDWKLVDFSVAIQSLRIRKSDSELACIRQAAKFANAGLERARETVRPAMSEIELAGHLELAMRELGSEYPAMPAWVSSGPRTAGAHKTPSGRRIEKGERLKLEFAGVCRRYHAVTMQTFWLGSAPPAKIRAAYEAAAQALSAGEHAIAIGKPVAAAETAAFEVLAANGFNLRWHSRFGYGVGIAYPPTWLEALDITRESAQTFEANQSFTLHIAVKDPVEGLGLMLGGAYVLSEDGLEVLSGGALELTIV